MTQQKEIIDALIKWIIANKETVLVDEDNKYKYEYEYIDYKDLEQFVKILQTKYLGHVNPDMHPLWED